MIFFSGDAPATILYADDNGPARKALAEFLRERGYRVLEAATGREALELAPQGHDLALLDMHLPDGDGLELCRQIKRDSSAPVLLISGVHVAAADKVRGLEGGADGYLIKPVEPAEVLAQIRALLRVRRAEEERRRAADLLRAVVEATPDAVFVKDGDGRHLLFNPAAARFVGRPVEEVLGRCDAELFDAESARRLGERDRRVMETGRLETEEERLTAAGVTRTYLATKAPYRDERGNVVGVIGVSRDVTEQVAAQEALRLRDRAIQAVTQGILITDASRPDDPILYASPGFERLTGYVAAEVVGRNCRFLQGPRTDPAAAARLREAVRERRPCSVEILNYRRDGTTFWNALSVSPVRDGEGRVTHFVGVQADITERRRLEEQYLQAQKLEAVGRLAGGVAHDFNNLLTVINGYGELLLAAVPPEDPSREMIGEMARAGERAAALTRQLLTFSRQSVLSPKVLDLNAVVLDLEKMLGRVIGEDVDLRTALQPGAGLVRIDPGQIEQVVMNLAVNARDAMPEGGRLTIETRDIVLDEGYARLHAGVRAGSYVLLAVSDTGHGMTPEVRARVFEPFFTTKEKGKGTGLGLATVFGIVQQAGGHVAVYSEPGAGATFKVYLPRVDEAPAADQGRGATTAPGGSETILLVEDEEAVRSLTRSILQGKGYRVLEAADGATALAVAGRHAGAIDLLLSDVVMPHLGGRQLAERLLAAHPGLKVLFQSGYTDDAVVRHGVLQEKVHFLQKPFTPAALAQKVREVLDSAG